MPNRPAGSGFLSEANAATGYINRGATVAGLPSPSFWAHGGVDGGDAPTDSLAAYDDAAQKGLVVDMNTTLLGDGAIGCTHGPYLQTMNGRSGTDKAEWLTSLTWQAESLIQPTRYTSASITLRPPLFRDFLGRYTNRVVTSPEIKLRTYDADGGVANGLIHAAKMRDDILAYGGKYSTIVQCFNYAVLAPLVAAGINTMWLADDTTVNGPTLAAAGITWIGVSTTASQAQAQITSAKANGLKVMIYDPLRYNDYAALTGYDAVDSDQASYLSGAFRSKTDKFRSGAPVPGMVPGASLGSAGTISGTAGTWGWSNNDDVYRGMLHGYMQPTSQTSYTFQTDLQIAQLDASSDITRWAGIVLSATTDVSFDNVGAAGGTNGYHILFRASGTIDIFRLDAGTGTKIFVASLVTAPVTVGTTWVTVSIAVSATQLTVTRQDLPAATLSAGLTSGVAVTSLPVAAIGTTIPSGTTLLLPNGQAATLSAQATAGATTISVNSITPNATIASGGALKWVAVATDSTYRGKFLHLGRLGVAAYFRNVSIT